MRIRVRHVLAAAGVAAVAAAATIVLTTNATAAITSSTLVNPVSNKCLDVTGGSNANGTQVEIWTCHSGANQLWTSTSAGELRVTISGVTKCLDASGASTDNGTANGTIVEVWTCKTAGNNTQRWVPGGGGTTPPPVGKMAAPYLYEGWGDPPSVSTVMSATGIKQFTMAFMLSGGGCTPAW